MVKKTIFMICVFVLCSLKTKAQSSYPSTAYAVNTDTLYLTGAGTGSYDFSITGANSTWDYSSLTGTTQQRLVFRNPKQTGFTAAQWPYIQNAGNVNLSSTNGQSIAIGSIQTVNPNDYFKITTSVLQQSASSYDVYVGDKKISIKNTYTTPDVIYNFPLAYGNTADSSIATYATNIPNVYYNSSTIQRKNEIDGWGIVKTPYGTFNNALRMVSTVEQTDSIAINNAGLPKIYTVYREIKWLDASKKYPVLIVHQNKVGSQFVTSTISYLDIQQFYQPSALFGFYPVAPQPADTVRFQNLSVNSLNFSWDFGDPSSGSNNSSTLTNPQHIYTIAGRYQIKLKAYNGMLVDSIMIPIQIGTTPTASFTYSPTTLYINDVVAFQNTSTNGTTYSWDFGDPSSGASNNSTSSDPQHTYSVANSYQVKLKVYNGTLVDSISQTIQVNSVVTTLTPSSNEQQVIVYPNPFEQSITFLSHENYSRVTVTNLSGQIVFENLILENTVDLSTLQKGYYIVSLTDQFGKQTHTKVIKK